MKITRSSKCYFNKWLTQKKVSELRDILQEYARVCNYFVETYENEIPEKRKFDLTLATHILLCGSPFSNNFIIIWLKQTDLSFGSGTVYKCSLPLTINTSLAVSYGYHMGVNYHYYQPLFQISSTDCGIDFWPTDQAYQPQTSTVELSIIVLAN